MILHQLIATPILYDFYNYNAEDKEFINLFIQFTQNMSLLGALLFFIEMKNSSPRRQPKKKTPKRILTLFFVV
ncbi:putative HR-like lesion-inducer [Lupinus albus]|uniref:Putative HR-like lesion-inducer n=1 Tax=Lupinus albus TaxID=3870 RepID=A0A6A4NFS7_LUPAL|nr:putative HR-like lesion-inducer [Lupinus albus]